MKSKGDVAGSASERVLCCRREKEVNDRSF